MTSIKFDQMFHFISQNKYEISKNIPDSLKCKKCKNILINAYCVPCGCSYCCDCLNEMLNNDVENCPGNSEDCKVESISSSQVDHRRNRKISNIVIKCPEEMCPYECAIINMEEHVRVCEKKPVKCPFANVGCDGKKIAREMLNEHCQSSNFNHCKILIEIIDNMKNEINQLKDNDEKNQLKIKNLEKNLKSKILETNIKKLHKIVDYFEYAMIEWQIDKLDERRKEGGCILSEYFTGTIRQYKLQLQLFYADGYDGDIKGKGCSIYLCIYSGESDQFLSWPFKADVTVKIISKTNPNIKKGITKNCKIDKPINISYNCSEAFNYLYCDLTNDGEILDNCFIVECFINFK